MRYPQIYSARYEEHVPHPKPLLPSEGLINSLISEPYIDPSIKLRYLSHSHSWFTGIDYYTHLPHPHKFEPYQSGITSLGLFSVLAIFLYSQQRRQVGFGVSSIVYGVPLLCLALHFGLYAVLFTMIMKDETRMIGTLFSGVKLLLSISWIWSITGVCYRLCFRVAYATNNCTAN